MTDYSVSKNVNKMYEIKDGLNNKKLLYLLLTTVKYFTYYSKITLLT